jgi:hypothetical protein
MANANRATVNDAINAFFILSSCGECRANFVFVGFTTRGRAKDSTGKRDKENALPFAPLSAGVVMFAYAK